ncbi:unnamed protein product, partial [Amoebophrya sp. A25]|eukprot:GSA25T00022956001.1
MNAEDIELLVGPGGVVSVKQVHTILERATFEFSSCQRSGDDLKRGTRNGLMEIVPHEANMRARFRVFKTKLA